MHTQIDRAARSARCRNRESRSRYNQHDALRRATYIRAPDVILRGVGGDPTPAAMQYLSMSGLTGALFGEMLWQALRARTLLSILIAWSTLQKFVRRRLSGSRLPEDPCHRTRSPRASRS